MDIRSHITAIHPSESDLLLRSWGFDLVTEYLSIAEQVPSTQKPILELATGTGRMCAVLSTLGHRIITGDISIADRSKVQQRVPVQLQERLTFVQLDMESLPFKTNSVETIICMNTLHETGLPEQCIREMIRILHPDGTLVIGDFNERGFDTMQRLHEAVYHDNHERGTISLVTIHALLADSFVSVRAFETTLNTTYYVSTKKSHRHN